MTPNRILERALRSARTPPVLATDFQRHGSAVKEIVRDCRTNPPTKGIAKIVKQCLQYRFQRIEQIIQRKATK